MSDDRSAQRYLEDLTPGGSEYYNNPKRCFAWASGRIEATHRIALEAALARNRQAERADAAEAALAAAQAQIARLTAALAWYADPANSDRGPDVIPWTTNISRDRGERARVALALPEQPVRPGVLRSAACEQHGVRLCATCAGFEGGSPWAGPTPAPGEPSAEE